MWVREFAVRIRDVTKRIHVSQSVTQHDPHSPLHFEILLPISKSSKQHTALETLILFGYISKIKYTLYSPPPKLEIAGLLRRWVVLLIRDINNVIFTSAGSTGLLRFEWDPGAGAVCSNCWIFPVQNAKANRLF